MAKKNKEVSTSETIGPQHKHALEKKNGTSAWKLFLNIISMLIWTAAAILTSQLIVGNLLLSVLSEEVLIKPVWTAIYSALSYVFAMLLIMLVPARIKKMRTKNPEKILDRKVLGLRGLPTWTDIGLAPIGFIVYYLIAAVLVGIFTAFPWFDIEQAQDVGFNILASGLDRIVAFITLVIIAPIAEEIIFRGWLYGKMRNKLLNRVSNQASMIISIILVSLLFGIMHQQWNVGVDVFAMSIVLCSLREITGTIYSGILVHMLKNGVAFYLSYVAGVG